MNIQIKNKVDSNYFDTFLSYKKEGYKIYCHPFFKEYLEVNSLKILSTITKETLIHKSVVNVTFEKKINVKNPFGFSSIIIKKSRHRSFLNFIISPLKKSKAKQAFDAACHLIHHNLDTPLPIGYIEKKRLGFLVECYFITESVKPFTKVRKFLKRHLKYDIETDMKDLLKAVASYVQKMHNSGMMHRDLNLSNFLIAGDEAEKRLVLIDLNRYKLKELSPMKRIRDISRLYWKKYRYDFFDLYCNNEIKLRKLRWFYDLYFQWRMKRRRFINFLKGKRKK